MSRPPTTDLGAVAEAIRAHDRFLLVTHENPDGDALGSILGAKLALDRLGKESVMYLGGETAPPTEYGFLALDELRRELPGDASDRVLLALDCANAKRMAAAGDLLDRVPLSIDVDHHHDNSRFATINHVVADASSTGEIVRDLLRELDVALTLVISYRPRGDFHDLRVGEEYAEGIIDYLRSVEGAELAATIREPPEPPDAA